MSEQAPNPTEATAASEASGETLLTGSTSTDTTQQQESAESQSTTGDNAAGETKTQEAPQGAPEKYEFTAPDGQTYDAGLVDAFSQAAKDANLPQDSAQKIVEKMAPALAQRQADQIKAIQTGWLESTQKDPEFGGEKLMANMGVAAKALDAFDPKPAGQTTTPLRTLLKESGLGNNPEVIRFFYRAGKAISEDTFVRGGAPADAAKRIQDVLYDKTGA